MKNTFKPLALAAAVAGMSAGMAHAQTAGFYPTLGDAAFVPYYTVNGDWVTGVHITNTSDRTQVVKLRLRRAEDSLDILDFNLILSPYDVWTGTISGDESEMRFVTEDDSCTAPELLDNGDGRTYAPVFGPRIEGAQEGYLEVIGMGSADELQPISEAALHDSNGLPDDCDEVRENFFVAAVVANDETQISGSDGTSVYQQTDNVLKVSFFIRDDGTGEEFGNNAIHFEDFSGVPMMTHQQYGLEAFAQATSLYAPNDSLNGWDFPDVRGGGFNTGGRSSISVVRTQLGANSVLNDWSYNPATGAATDWVINFPGQYALEDYYQKVGEELGDDDSVWDYREIPALALFEVYDREEQSAIPGGLNFSPSPAPDTTTLSYEVNVIEWGGQQVLDSNWVTAVNPADAGITAPYGWANLIVSANSGPQDGLLAPGDNGWCDVAAGPLVNGGINGEDACVMIPVSGPVPMIGFAAWERTFADEFRNYGRIVEHSFTTSN